jgi:hypothetical protein
MSRKLWRGLRHRRGPVERAERLDLGHAAVDEEFDTGDVAAVVGGQEHGRLGDLVGRSHAPERDRADEGVQLLGVRLGLGEPMQACGW